MANQNDKKIGAFVLVGRKLYETGYSVLPIAPGGKSPGTYQNGRWYGLKDWSRYCEELPSEAQIDEWEDYPDAGVGLACGKASGLVLIDYDYRPDLCEKIFKILPPSPIHKKGAKGFSAVYQYSGEISRSFTALNPETGKNESVVEILSAGRQSVLPPTVHPEGMEYHYLTPDTLLDFAPTDLPRLPTDVVSRIEGIVRGSSNAIPIQIRGTNKQQAPKTTNAHKESFPKIEDALKSIGSDDYDTWIKVGMAIHSEHPNEDGFRLWDQWSKKSDKYEGAKETAAKWKSFETERTFHGETITIATLFYFATQAGWNAEEWKEREIQQKFKKAKDFIGGCDDTDKLTTSVLKAIYKADFSNVQRETLVAIISKKTGVSLSALKKDGEALTKKQGDDEGLTEMEIARLVIESYGADNIITAGRRVTWIWTPKGLWKPVEDEAIKQRIHRVVEGEVNLVSRVVSSILATIKTETFKEEHVFNKDVTSINCENGELHFLDGQWVLKPHTKEHYRTTQSPISYDPAAKAPLFEKFLSDIFLGDHDASEKRKCVLEMIGYTLLCSTQFEKFIMLLGNTRNGKSVLLEVVKAICGTKNVAAVCPSRFNNQFSRAHLDGKLANIITELAEGAEIADAELKSIVSGELMTAEHKHQPPFEFEPVCTCWFGTNHMPYTRDYSGALGKRAIIINFNRQFEGKNCDTKLKKKLLLELPGILNLALEHLTNVLKRDSFTVCPSSEEALKQWQLENDQVAQFIEDECELGPDKRTTSEDAYNRYRAWATGSGVRNVVGRKTFTNRLARKGVKPKKGTNGVRLLLGIALRGAK